MQNNHDTALQLTPDAIQSPSMRGAKSPETRLRSPSDSQALPSPSGKNPSGWSMPEISRCHSLPYTPIQEPIFTSSRHNKMKECNTVRQTHEWPATLVMRHIRTHGCEQDNIYIYMCLPHASRHPSVRPGDGALPQDSAARAPPVAL